MLLSRPDGTEFSLDHSSLSLSIMGSVAELSFNVLSLEFICTSPWKVTDGIGVGMCWEAEPSKVICGSV